MDSQIERIMRSLKCSRAEAEEILAEDKKLTEAKRWISTCLPRNTSEP